MAVQIDMQWQRHATFTTDVGVAARVKATAPIANDMCEAFLAGMVNDGTQYFQRLLVDKIKSAELLDEDVLLEVDHIGTHIDNREGYGLIPSDVHDLLARIVHDGWSSVLVDAMAAEVPPNEIGDKWRAFNDKLAKHSLLPDIQTSFMKHVTARGSHTTSAVRLLKFPHKDNARVVAGGQ